jgi:hypothetical protein
VRTAAKVFLGSSLFAAGIAGAYWFVTYEPAGTALLGSMILAPGLMAAYAARAARGPRRGAEDRPDAVPTAPDAPEVGPVVPASVWPVVVGTCALFAAAGLVYGAWLLIPAGAVVAVALVGLVRE